MIFLNKIVVMNRGDSQDIILDFKQDFAAFWPLPKDTTVYFGLMDPGQPFERALIRKSFTAEDFTKDGELCIEITPDDTLDLLPAKYFYAVKLCFYDERNNEKVYTLINKTKFIICD